MPDVTIVRKDHQEFNCLKMNFKCSYYDKGYAKIKIKCTQRHPPLDCDGQCDDKKHVLRDTEYNAKMEQPAYILKLTTVNLFTQVVMTKEISVKALLNS